MTTYVPFTSSPFPTRPIGWNAGLDSADQDFIKKQAELLSLENMFIDQNRARAELDRFLRTTPGAVAKSDLEAALARAEIPYADVLARGKAGAAIEQAAKGQLTDEIVKNTLPNIPIQMKLQGLQEGLKFIDTYKPILEAAEKHGGNLEVQRVWTGIYNSLPGNIKQFFNPVYSPQIKSAINEIRDALVNTISHIQALNLETNKATNQIITENVKAGHNLNLENVRQSGALERTQLQTEMRDVARSMEGVVARYLQKLAGGTATNDDYMAAQAASEFLKFLRMPSPLANITALDAMRGNQGAIPSPTLPSPQREQVPQSGGQAPQLSSRGNAPKFSSKEEAAQAFKDGRIKVGDVIMIGDELVVVRSAK